MGLASHKRLLGDAEDSPVMDDAGDANQFLRRGAFIFKVIIGFKGELELVK